jgi:hypothetical protein
MKTKLIPVTLYFSHEDMARLKAEAAPYGFSVTKYIRKFLELPDVRRGAPVGNQNARRKKKRAVVAAKSSVRSSQRPTKRQAGKQQPLF